MFPNLAFDRPRLTTVISQLHELMDPKNDMKIIAMVGPTGIGKRLFCAQQQGVHRFQRAAHGAWWCRSRQALCELQWLHHAVRGVVGRSCSGLEGHL